LLSLAERIGFDWAFLIAGAGTVALLSVNAAWVFSSRILGVRASGMFGVLYLLIYLLLRMEDNALLVGAVASFIAVAGTMYLTRRIDWYGPLAGSGAPERQVIPPAPERDVPR
jgi:inner membrane protein